MLFVIFIYSDAKSVMMISCQVLNAKIASMHLVNNKFIDAANAKSFDNILFQFYKKVAS